MKYFEKAYLGLYPTIQSNVVLFNEWSFFTIFYQGPFFHFPPGGNPLPLSQSVGMYERELTMSSYSQEKKNFYDN